MITAETVDEIVKRDDIRGKYPDNINEDLAFFLGMALGQVVYPPNEEPSRVAVGYDARLSSPSLARSLIQGLMAERVQVFDLGMCSSEFLYFASGDEKRNLDGGIMITASHNPKDQNGFKMVRRGAEPTSSEDLAKIAQWLKKNAVGRTARPLDVAEDYAERVLRVSGLAGYAGDRKLRVVVEAGNGVGGQMFRRIETRVPFLDLVFSNEEPNGEFPVILPNPIDENYMKIVEKRVETEKADLGLAFDGDGDRVGIVDRKGRTVAASEIIALIAQRLFERDGSRRKIMVNLVTSRLVRDHVEGKLGGTVQVTPVGHAQIKKRMRTDSEVVFAGEHSSHFFFRDFYMADSGVTAGLVIAGALLSGEDLQTRIEQWRGKYFQSSEVSFKVADLEGPRARENMQNCVESIRKTFKARGGKAVIEYAPGDSIEPSGNVDILKMEFTEDFGDWWFVLRPSGTEAKLRTAMEVILRDDQVGKVDGRLLVEKRFRELIELIRKQGMRE